MSRMKCLINRASIKVRCGDVIRGHAARHSSLPWLSKADPEIFDDVEAIMVLAGGQTTSGSGLPTWVERRLDCASAIQQQKARASPPGGSPSIICLGGGTPHKPPILLDNGYVYHESTSCADYLIHNKGISPDTILKELSSFDTVGNAFFSLAIHAIPSRLRSIVVITSEFHMPRTKALFEDMYSIGATDALKDPSFFKLSFVSVTDEDLFSRDVLEARIDKEANSLKHWKENKKNIHSFKDLHHWLHSTHQCYAVSRQKEFSRRTITDPRLLASY